MRRLLAFILLLSLLVSCSPEPEKTFVVATWNLYAFFDGRDDGTEYDAFRRSAGYTGAKYEARIKSTASYILKHLGDADVIIVQEVESATVLHDLLSSGLDKHGFLWFGLAQGTEGSLGVGFLSKVKPDSMGVHGTDSSRLILQLDFTVFGRVVTVFGLHAKSRLGGGEEERAEEFSLLRRLMDEAEDSLTVALGDFNVDPAVGEVGIALERGNRFTSVPLLVTGDGGSAGQGIYYSPCCDYMKDLGEGTYWYEGEWSFLDNILVDEGGFDWEGLEFSRATLVAPPEAKDYLGHPLKYDVSTGKGYSDHFALKATFKYN